VITDVDHLPVKRIELVCLLYNYREYLEKVPLRLISMILISKQCYEVGGWM
jgi:hypothetical protein